MVACLIRVLAGFGVGVGDDPLMAGLVAVFVCFVVVTSLKSGLLVSAFGLLLEDPKSLVKLLLECKSSSAFPYILVLGALIVAVFIAVFGFFNWLNS